MDTSLQDRKTATDTKVQFGRDDEQIEHDAKTAGVVCTAEDDRMICVPMLGLRIFDHRSDWLLCAIGRTAIGYLGSCQDSLFLV